MTAGPCPSNLKSSSTVACLKTERGCAFEDLFDHGVVRTKGLLYGGLCVRVFNGSAHRILFRTHKAIVPSGTSLIRSYESLFNLLCHIGTFDECRRSSVGLRAKVIFLISRLFTEGRIIDGNINHLEVVANYGIDRGLVQWRLLFGKTG